VRKSGKDTDSSIHAYLPLFIALTSSFQGALHPDIFDRLKSYLIVGP
jgi:hypothetical protein